MTGWEPGSRRATDGLDWRPGARDLAPHDEAPVDPRPAPPAAPAASPSRTPGLPLIAAIAGVSALVGGAIAGGIVALLNDDGGESEANTQAATAPNAGSLTIEQTNAIIDVAEKARPSVVRIESAASDGRDVGSGVVLDNQGHIVTNAHVILGTEDLRVILPNGEERPAILLGHDYPFTDVAVLQIGPGGLTPVEVGDSKALSLGETVVAIGNPLAEFDGTVTVGVVSGIDRSRVFDNMRYSDLIQTDAAVNAGNSGGALLNLQGQFVGMPTSVVRESNSGTVVEGIAFAIPSARVLEVANLIIDQGSNPARASLQIEHADISPEIRSRIRGLAVDEGAIVLAVAPGGAADAAGITEGDVITALGNLPVNRSTLLYNALVEHQPGELVKVVLNRGGKIIETEVRLATR